MKFGTRQFWCVVALGWMGLGPAGAAVSSWQNPVGNYGWLDQFSLNSDDYPGEDCAPTSSTNAMTFLQNTCADYFGPGGLTGTTYADWINADETLRGSEFMNSGPHGTGEADFITGLHRYITEYKGFDDVAFSGVYHSDIWSGSTAPSYITAGLSTVEFVFDSLQAGGAFIANLHYEDGGGHVLAVSGITWDPESGSGTLTFIDPLDPANYDAQKYPESPKFTTGDIFVESGTLTLVYSQYHGGKLPWTGQYGTTSAAIHGGLTFVVPEPSTWALAGVAGLAFAVLRRRGGRFRSGRP